MKWALLACCLATNAAAQTKPADAIVVLRDQFIACAKRSALTFYKPSSNRELAVEKAFQACTTEEQAAVATLRAGMSALGPDAAMVTWTRVKLRIKQDIVAALP